MVKGRTSRTAAKASGASAKLKFQSWSTTDAEEREKRRVEREDGCVLRRDD